MLDAILPLRRSVVASRLSRPARSFFQHRHSEKTRSAKANTRERRRMPCRAASMATRWNADLFGGSTGVLVYFPRRVAGRGATSEGPGSAHRPENHTGGRADLSDPAADLFLCFFKQEVHRLDALKYREQGFGLRSLITCVKSHMQGDQMCVRSIRRNVNGLPFQTAGRRNG